MLKIISSDLVQVNKKVKNGKEFRITEGVIL